MNSNGHYFSIMCADEVYCCVSFDSTMDKII